MRHPRTALAVALALALAVAIALVDPAAAHVVTLKDGFTLGGQVKRTVAPVDGMAMSQINGSFMMDGGLKWTFFPFRQVAEDGISDEEFRAGDVRLTRPLSPGTRPLPNTASFTRVTAFNDKWDRTLYVRESSSVPETPIPQRLVALTPFYARVMGIEHAMSATFSTQELGVETVTKLLNTHELTREEAGKPDLDRMLRRFRFFAQAEWFETADKELDRVLAAFPDAKDKVDEARKALRGSRGMKVLEEAERFRASGRYRSAADLLGVVGKPEELPEKVLGRLNEMKVKAETAEATQKSARSLLTDLATALSEGPDAVWLKEAAKVIDEGLSEETANRLELFVTLAEQAEADRKKGKQTVQPPEELLSLAVTGWLLGRNASEARVSTARKLWKARQFVLDYLRADTDGARAGILAKYQANQDAADVAEITQLIPSLPPVEPAALTPNKPTTEFKTASGNKYVVRVPPEYSHHRRYPVVLALHHPTQTPAELAEGMSFEAARHGYIIVAPDWTDGFQQTYEYSTAEHNRVLDTLRDVRRRYQIDSDRVFLFGFAEGGTAACDIGLSHPDHFAGVVPMGTGYSWSLGMHYWHNARNLPMYVISGENAGSAPKWLKKLFDEFHPQGFNSLLVLYKGRGLEWFGIEMPTAYEWMNRRRRVFPAQQVGGGGTGGSDASYRSLRAGDNRFYWLTSTGTRDIGKRMPPAGEVVPAKFNGAVLSGNRVDVTVVGASQVSVWLAQGMVDFTKPVAITVSGNPKGSMTKLFVPNLQLMLDDLAERGDRQQLFWGRADFGK